MAGNAHAASEVRRAPTARSHSKAVFKPTEVGDASLPSDRRKRNETIGRVAVTLDDLVRTLPNGLHDAEIRTFAIDYGRHQLTMDLSVWVGDMDEREAPREGYRDATLTLDGVVFIVMEAPDPTYEFAEQDHLWVDVTHDPKHIRLPQGLTPPSDCFVSGFFNRFSNSYIYVAARSASLTWRGETYDRDPPG